MAAPELVRSALVVFVPEADPVVGAVRDRFDPSAKLGVAAHLTLLIPFAAPSELTEAVLADVARVVAAHQTFEFSLGRFGWFGTDVLWLGPDPVEPFVALTESLGAAFPRFPRYGGSVPGEIVPHLTLGNGAPTSELVASAPEVDRHLPICSVAHEVSLVAGSPTPGSWRTIERFALGS